MSRVLIVDCFDSFTYNIHHYLDSLLPGRCDVVRYDAISDVDPTEFSRIVLSPGPGLPADYPAIGGLLDNALPKTPILGVCLGLQCMVAHFGGRLRRLGEVKHGVPGQLLVADECLLLDGFEKNQIAHYHSWVADETEFPEDILRVTARDLENNIMAIEHRFRPLCAVQFHPESVLTTNGIRLFKNWIEY